MARTFDGIDDAIRCSIASPINVGFGTIAAIVKRTTTTWNTILSLNTSAVATKLSLAILPDAFGNNLRMAGDDGNSSSDSSFTVMPADNWVFLCAAKATGTVAVDFWEYVYDTDTWSTSTGGTLANAGLPGTSGTARIGEWGTASDPWDGQIAAVAMWARKLTDAEVRNLPHNLFCWIPYLPDAMWVLDQGATSTKVNDWSGNGSNESSLIGTSVSTLAAPVGYGGSILKVTAAAAPAAAALRNFTLLGIGQ